MNRPKDKASILYVDSDTTSHTLMRTIFSDKYDYSSCGGGDACIQYVMEKKPDIILLDIDLEPGLDGLEVCRKLRQELNDNDTSIIFLSHISSNDVRFKCYDAGGNDFITKPFDIWELIQKIESLLKIKRSYVEMVSTQATSQHMINLSMSSMAEQGLILRFIQDSLTVNDYAALSRLFFATLANYGLTGSIAIWRDKEDPNYSSTGVGHPLELSIMQVARERNQQKIATYGARCLVTGNETSLLIRNMPEDEEKFGRYKDNMAMLIDSLDLLVKNIHLKHELVKSEMQVAQAMLLTNQSISQSIVTIRRTAHNNRKKNQEIIRNLAMNMEQQFMTMGLTEEQEEKLMAMIDDTEQQSDALYVDGIQLDEEMEKIKSLLKKTSDERWKNSNAA